MVAAEKSGALELGDGPSYNVPYFSEVHLPVEIWSVECTLLFATSLDAQGFAEAGVGMQNRRLHGMEHVS